MCITVEQICFAAVMHLQYKSVFSYCPKDGKKPFYAQESEPQKQHSVCESNSWRLNTLKLTVKKSDCAVTLEVGVSLMDCRSKQVFPRPPVIIHTGKAPSERSASI